MKPIALVVEEMLQKHGIQYLKEKGGLYSLKLADATILVDVREDERLFNFSGFNGITIHYSHRKECLEYLNECNMKYRTISWIDSGNGYWVRSSGCARGYELTEERAYLYFSEMLNVLYDENVNAHLRKMTNGSLFSILMDFLSR